MNNYITGHAPVQYGQKKTCLIWQVYDGDPKENRTPVAAVKGRCLDRLTMGPYVA